MKKLILLIFLTGISITNSAQTGKIIGKITNSNTGASLPGVSVYLEGTNKGAATDLDGNYFIAKVQHGNYNLIAMYLGYYKVVLSEINVDNETTEINISLSPTNSVKGLSKEMETFYLNNLPLESQKILNEFKELNESKYFLTLQEVHFKNSTQDLDIERENKILLLKLKEETIANKLKKNENPALEEELKNIINELLELQESQRIKQIYYLELKLNKLKISIAEIRYNKGSVITNRFKQLLKQ